MTEEKRCGRCGGTKPLAAFSRNRAAKDGHQNRCKECVAQHYAANPEPVRARVNAHRALDPDAARERSRLWRAENPERAKMSAAASYKKRSDYYRRKASLHYADNRERALDQARAWVANNREIVRAAKTRYKHRRRMWQESSEFRVTGRDLLREFNRSPMCSYCRVRFQRFDDATWDHVIPVSRGGSFGVGNLVPACGPCNSAKNRRTVMEWRMSRTRQSLTVL